jgi:SAM-dependent methyltransferase
MADEQLQLTVSEQLQKGHYEALAEQYETHYSDPCTQQYRTRFMYEPMLAGIELRGRRVLDAMCGSGQATEYLLAQGAEVVGLDISTQAIAAFRANWPACQTVCRSALDSGLESESFDCIVVVGGLHHAHPHINEAVGEFQRLLKPGGYFCFVEPHSGSVLDVARRLWYKFDPFFSENEESVDLAALKSAFATQFMFRRETYLGNVAYLSVLNSMVLRIPLRWKTRYAPALMRLEAALNRLQGRRTSCCVVAQWQKR